MLTFKVPNKNCSRRHFNFFTFIFLKKIRFEVSCESSALQRIHMKYRLIFSEKKRNVFMNAMIGALRVKASE